MHPVLTSRINFILYLAAWLLLSVITMVLLTASGSLGWIESLAIALPLHLFLAFICLSPWYTCRHLPLGSTPAWKLLGNHLLAAVVSAGAVVLLAMLLAAAWSGVFPGVDQRIRPAMPVLAGTSDLLYLLSVALHYVLLAAQSSREARILAHEAELKALKMQINPHFLFNSLHSVSALIPADPAKAREMCLRLSDFLRNTLRLGEKNSIAFRDELSLSSTYLDVEQVRFGRRLRVVQEIEAGCEDCEVPPLILQPLVENAVKHGIATLIEGGEIALRCRRSQDSLRLVIENAFDPETPAARRNGMGLSNVRNRLQERYGSAASLEIQMEENRYRVVLLLPCKTAAR